LAAIEVRQMIRAILFQTNRASVPVSVAARKLHHLTVVERQPAIL
jgi:hypothetical protein